MGSLPSIICDSCLVHKFRSFSFSDSFLIESHPVHSQLSIQLRLKATLVHISVAFSQWSYLLSGILPVSSDTSAVLNFDLSLQLIKPAVYFLSSWDPLPCIIPEISSPVKKSGKSQRYLFLLSQKSQSCTVCYPMFENNRFIYFVQFSHCFFARKLVWYQLLHLSWKGKSSLNFSMSFKVFMLDIYYFNPSGVPFCFKYGMRQRSNFIFCQMDKHFFLAPFIQWSLFPPQLFEIPTLPHNNVSYICMGLFLSTQLYSSG